MKSKLGILSALILSVAVAGSAFASTKTIVKKKAPAAKTSVTQKTKTAKTKKHRSTKKMTKKAKSTMTAPAPTK